MLNLVSLIFRMIFTLKGSGALVTKSVNVTQPVLRSKNFLIKESDFAQISQGMALIINGGERREVEQNGCFGSVHSSPGAEDRMILMLQAMLPVKKAEN